MLTGYNTDVIYEGVTYHVQTEDKGLAHPIILSLVYQGGTILAAKRTNYEELINEGAVDEPQLAARLERQHRIIIAAIQAGKIDRLAKHSQDEAKPRQPDGSTGELPSKPTINQEAPAATPSQSPESEPEIKSARSLEINLDQMIDGYLETEEPRERLGIELLTTPRFKAGEQVTVRAVVLFDGHRPVDNALVKLQIVGTAIKPLSFAAQADRSGLVSFTVRLPQFTSGTAALILRASEPKGQEVEAKFLINRK